MFKKPLSITGRIRRTEYALSFVVYATILIFSTVTILSGGSTLFLLAYPLLGWFGIAQNAKRYHDRGNSGWYQFIPFYVLWLLLGGSEPGTNKYGPNSKGAGSIEMQPAV